MKKLTIMFAFVAMVIGFNGCKKNDYLQNTNQLSEKEIIEKFTKVPKGLNPLLQKIAENLKEKDAKTAFIAKVGSKTGVPLWGKAQFKLRHTSNAAAREMLEGEQTVLIPLSVPNSSEVDGFVAAVIDANGDVKSVSEYDKFNYYLLGFNKTDSERDAEDVAMQILILQKEVFGSAKFKILDNKLFNSQDGSTAARKNFEISLSETPQNSSSSSRVIVVKHNHCTGHSGTGPNGNTDDSDCDQCDNCGFFTFDIIFFDSPWNWGGGGGIGGGIGGGVFGGSGGWGSAPFVYSVSNVWQNLGLTLDQNKFVNDFNNKPFLNEIASFMQDESFSSESKTAAKAVLNAYMNNKINGPYDLNHFNELVYDMPSTSIAAGATAYFDKFITEKAIYNSYNTGWSDAKTYFYSTFMTNRWLGHLWHQSPWELFNKNEISYLLSHPSIKDEIDYLMTSNIVNYDYTPESVVASRMTIKAIMNNAINGFPNQQFFDNYVNPYLPTRVQNMPSADFLSLFNNIKNNLMIANPSSTQEEIYTAAMQQTLLLIDNDYGVDEDPTIYNLNNLDQTIYQQYNTSIPFPPYGPVLTEAEFVPYYWGKTECYEVGLAMLKKKGYTTSAYNTTNQTFKTYKEGNSPPLNESETKKAISYLLDALSKGIPVMVGVHDGRTGGNQTDGTTDHWLIITGSGNDAYGSYFTYVQTNTQHPSKAFDSSFKLRYIPGKGLVTDCTSALGCVPGKVVSQVRKSKKI